MYLNVTKPDSNEDSYLMDFNAGANLFYLNLTLSENEPIGIWECTISVYDQEEGVIESEVTEIQVLSHQYLLTVSSPYGTPIGGGWYDAGSITHCSLDIQYSDPVDNARHRFSNWVGDATGTDFEESSSIVMDRVKSVVAEWQLQYSLTLITVGFDYPETIFWKDSGSITWLSWTSNVSIITEGEERAVFTQWGGNATGTDYSKSSDILMDAPKTVYSFWRTQYYLRLISAEWQAYIEGEGWYDESDTAYLSLSTAQINQTDVRRIFESWDGNASGTDHEQSNAIIMDDYMEVTVNDYLQYRVTVESDQDTVEGYYWVDEGDDFSITVEPFVDIIVGKSRWVCNGSIIDDSVTSNTEATFAAINSPHIVVFTWIRQYYLEISCLPSDLEIVDSFTTQSDWHNDGTSATVVAYSIDGYFVREWTLDGLAHYGTNSSTTVTMDDYHLLICQYEMVSVPSDDLTMVVVIVALAGVGIVGVIGGVWFLKKRQGT